MASCKNTLFSLFSVHNRHKVYHVMNVSSLVSLVRLPSKKYLFSMTLQDVIIYVAR